MEERLLGNRKRTNGGGDRYGSWEGLRQSKYLTYMHEDVKMKPIILHNSNKLWLYYHLNVQKSISPNFKKEKRKEWSRKEKAKGDELLLKV
jgi:hypothetical protein